MIERKKKILVLSRAVQETFTSSEWTEIGYLTGTDEWIDSHPRLLRSLNWGDSDYKGYAMEAVARMLDQDPANLKILVEYGPVEQWLKKHEPGVLSDLQSEVRGIEDVTHHDPHTATDTGLEALADAQELLRSRGPASAVDRIHTGLHDFFRAACDEQEITYPEDATANQLLKVILEKHPALQDLGSRSEEVKRILRTSASIIDAFGTLRNRASLAHPNPDLLGQDEARLVINMARSLLRYFDDKIN